MPGSCSFREDWLEKPEYSPWLRKRTNTKEAFCSVCKATIHIAAMGEGALKSHIKGAKHKKNVAAIDKIVAPMTDFFGTCSEKSASVTATNSTALSTSSASITSRKDANLSSFVLGNDVLKAEVIWAMKCVTSHFSMKSCDDIKQLFQLMFPDSHIASSFTCGETKARYLCTFGLAPYFADALEKTVKSLTSYVLLFDEPLNPHLQEKQLDVYVRFWQKDSVVTRYFDSKFMGHATSEMMLDELNPVVTALGHSKLLQLAMDGPNVNIKLERLLKEDISKQTPMKMLEIGTCGLHILHNAFRAGCAASSWDLETVLSSCYKLFHDTPARREDFVSLTGASKFPKKFCRHRWLENAEPAQAVIDLLPNLEKYCSAARTSQVTEPSCQSFTDLLKYLADPLLKSKLEFFVCIAKEMEPFLSLYQTDRPMIPFLFDDLGGLIKDLMMKIVKTDVMGEKVGIKAVMCIDLRDAENLKDPSRVDIGFCAKRSSLSTKASDRERFKFRMECRDFVKAMLLKLLDKAPVKYKLIRCLSWLQPKTMLSTNGKRKENALLELHQTLDILCEAGRVKAENCDHVKRQYSKFCAQLIEMEDDSAFTKFDHKLESHRIDFILYQHLNNQSEMQLLWKVIQQILLLSHGQASVERGFSINKELTVDNLQKEGLKARRHIQQAVNEAGGVTAVPITKELLSYASSAYNKYQAYLERQKREREQEIAAQKRKAKNDEIQELKAKRSRLMADAEALETSANKKAEEAENKGKLSLIAESNALRKRGQEKRTAANKIDKLIAEKAATQ